MRTLSFLALLAALFLAEGLAGCAHKEATAPTSSATAPTALAAVCPPTIAAASLAEPAPPRGVDLDVMYEAIAVASGEDLAKAWWKWFTVTYPDWGRQGWERIDKARILPPCGSG